MHLLKLKFFKYNFVFVYQSDFIKFFELECDFKFIKFKACKLEFLVITN